MSSSRKTSIDPHRRVRRVRIAAFAAIGVISIWLFVGLVISVGKSLNDGTVVDPVADTPPIADTDQP